MRKKGGRRDGAEGSERGMLGGEEGRTISSSFPTAKDAPSAASRAQPFLSPVPLSLRRTRTPNTRAFVSVLVDNELRLASDLISRRVANTRTREAKALPPLPPPDKAESLSVHPIREMRILTFLFHLSLPTPPLPWFQRVANRW